MPTLSKHYATVTFFEDDLTVEPISVDISLDETRMPYCVATVTLPTSVVPTWLDPRDLRFIGLNIQQDFGDLIYMHEVTTDFGGDISNITAAISPMKVATFTRRYAKPWNIFETGLPLSTVTAAYTPVTPAKMTTAGFSTVWKMSDYLHAEGTFNPAPSTMLEGYLSLRSVSRDYITKETVIELASNESLLDDSVGIWHPTPYNYTSLRDLINNELHNIIDPFTSLEAGTVDKTYSPAYAWARIPERTAWEQINELVQAAGLVLFCDSDGKWYLNESDAVSGDLELTDNDNITALTSSISRDSDTFFNWITVEYRNDGAATVYDIDAINFWMTGYRGKNIVREGIPFPGYGAATSLLNRGKTRGEIYSVESISNYNARPRQNMTINLTDEPDRTAIIQSVSFSLPSARMSVDIRDLQEV